MEREKRESKREEGGSVKNRIAIEGEEGRKTVIETMSVFHQSIIPRPHLLTRRIQTMTEDVIREDVAQTIVTTIEEVSVGGLVHVAHRGGGLLVTIVADAQDRGQHLAREKGGRWSEGKESGIVIETALVERRAAALPSQQIQRKRRRREVAIMVVEEAELLLNRMMYLAFQRCSR